MSFEIDHLFLQRTSYRGDQVPEICVLSSVPQPKEIRRPIPIRELIRINNLNKEKESRQKGLIKLDRSKDNLSFKLFRTGSDNSREKEPLSSFQTVSFAKNRNIACDDSHKETKITIYNCLRMEKTSIDTLGRLYDLLLKIFLGIPVAKREFNLTKNEKLILAEVLRRKNRETIRKR